MGKRTVYTKITPLPRDVPRQLALDMLHSHEEVIKINPLVTGVRPINAPRDAASDEFFAQWYEISEIITWGFGMKKKIAFKGVFHDLPNGLQTHTYAPMGVDLRNKWTVRGNQPGEPREPRELGIDTPQEGLYLREDVEIVCNLALTGFVKKEMKAAAGIMVDRLTRKAEMLDEGRLHAMFENGRLKTVNPAIAQDGPDDMLLHHRDTTLIKNNGMESPGSPGSSSSPSIFTATTKYENYHDLMDRRSGNSNHRASSYTPSYQQSGYQGPERQSIPGAEKTQLETIPASAIEMDSGSYYHPQQQGQKMLSPNTPSFAVEMADTSISAANPPMPSPGAERPAPLNPHRKSGVPSPQPSPGLVQRHSSSQSSHQPLPPGPRASSGSSSRQPNPPYPAGQYPQASPPISQQQQQQALPPPPPGPSPQLQQGQFQHPAHRPSPPGQQGQYPHPANQPSPPGQQTQYQQPAGQHSQPGQYTIANPSQGSPYSQDPNQQLASQVQGLGIQDPRAQADATQFGTKGGVSKCPVCGNFEGDEAAVSHHVSKHFS
ncbi:hypothetical protein B0A48_09814 [Cryoendolithus antarcticus]|uniref:DUF7053 domain-containing protein n=1 Tax=Cryoendolithus antarcticus TaxID=1507870 RepID=A0A1V8T386_9PEZI|nr:hypothetical protein B0A48_09814 [Cryoendolithus antarcticus]